MDFVSSELLTRISSATTRSNDDGSSRTELDSHADSPVVGKHAYILYHTGRTVGVSGFSDKLGSVQSVPVVHAAIVYDCPTSGESYVLFVNNALHFRDLPVNLIHPFIMRMAGLVVDECPKYMPSAPTVANHSIYAAEYDVRVPLKLHGCASYFPSRTPSVEDLLPGAHVQINITPNTSLWDPHCTSYADQEAVMTDYKGNMKETVPISTICSVNATCNEVVLEPSSRICSVLSRVSNTLHLGEFASAIKRRFGASTEKHAIYAVRSGKQKGVSVTELARVFNIGMETAEKTLRATEQLCIRSSGHPSLSRRFSTNDRMLRYRRVSSDVFMDTFFASVPSMKKNKCVQVFCTDFCYFHVKSMEMKCDAPKAVKRFFKEVGVPPNLICDPAPEQVKGDTRKICEEANCTIRQLEKGIQWANRAEGAVNRFKLGVKKLLKESDAPLVLWDYCLERLCKIFNHTALNLFQLDGMALIL